MIPGHHINEMVARKLHTIFDRFGILGRVRYVTTDNAGEYSAAFKNYGLNYRAVHLSIANDGASSSSQKELPAGDNAAGPSSTSTENAPTLPETDDESDDDDDPDQYVPNHNPDSSADRDPESFWVEEVTSLPNMNRVQCSMHKFDKIGKIDAKDAIGKDDMYDMLHEDVFAKLEAIWKQKDSRINSETFYHITGRKLVIPHRIRFLKTLEAVCFYFVQCNLK